MNNLTEPERPPVPSVFSSRIIDFHRPTGPADTHPLLFDWVRQYFSQSSRSTKLPPRLTSTSLPPLYLQHHGKVTIVKSLIAAIVQKVAEMK